MHPRYIPSWTPVIELSCTPCLAYVHCFVNAGFRLRVWVEKKRMCKQSLKFRSGWKSPKSSAWLLVIWHLCAHRGMRFLMKPFQHAGPDCFQRWLFNIFSLQWNTLENKLKWLYLKQPEKYLSMEECCAVRRTVLLVSLRKKSPLFKIQDIFEMSCVLYCNCKLHLSMQQ